KAELIIENRFRAERNRAVVSNASALNAGSVITVVDKESTLTLIGDVTFENNANSIYGTVFVNKGTINAGDIIKLNNNTYNDSQGYNLVFSKATTSYMMKGIAGHKLASESRISISSLEREVRVFEYWNDTYIDKFNTVNDYYSVQNIFTSDAPFVSNGKAAVVYKSGVYEQVALKWGYDYSTLYFKKDASQLIVATQYIANRVETFVDRVVLDNKVVAIPGQVWAGPDLYDENVDAEWYWGYDENKKFTAKVTKDRYVYLSSHKHRLCGLPATASCAHYDKATHSVVNFAIVTQESDILGTINQRKWALMNDIVITQNIPFLDDSAICLNGNNLILEKGVQINVIAGRKLTITDCRRGEDQGSITEGAASAHYYNSSVINVANGQLNLYNIKFATYSITDTSVTDTIINVANVNAKLYAEDLVFDNVNNFNGASNNPLIRTANRNIIATISNLTIKNSTINNDVYALLNIHEGWGVKYATISLIGNVANKKLVQFDQAAGATGIINIDYLYAKGNKVTGEGGVLYNDNRNVVFEKGIELVENDVETGLVYLTGAGVKFGAKEFIKIKDNRGNKGAGFYVKDTNYTLPKNATITNNEASEGAAIYLDNAKLIVPNESTKSVIENNFADKGGVIYSKNSTIEVEKLWTIKNNDGNKGSVLYVDENSKDVEITKLILENNKGNEVIHADSTRKVTINDIKFNNNKATESIINIENAAKSDIYDVTFAGNNSEDNIINVKNTKVEVGKDVAFNNNTVKGGLINANISSVSVAGNADMTNNKVADAAITFESNANSEVKLTGKLTYTNNEGSLINLNDAGSSVVFAGDAKVTSNKVLGNAMVNVTNGVVYLGGKVVLKDNKDNSNNELNLLATLNGKVKGNREVKLASNSEIYVSVSNNNDTVFEYWNKDYVASFSETVAPVISFTPDYIFHVDNVMARNNFDIYKEGTYPDVRLKVGDNFAKVSFREEKNSSIIFATQNIAKNVETYIDKLVLHDRDIVNQEWVAPSVDDENEKVAWLMAENMITAKVSKDTVVYLNNHTHTICGNEDVDTAAHYNGEIHTDIYNFVYIKDEDGLDKNLATGKYKYFALATNVEITKTITFASGSTLCLNGYTLSVKKGVELFNIANEEHINITDCTINKTKGRITRATSETDNVKQHIIQVSDGVVNVYNIEVSDMKLSNETEAAKQTFLYVTGKGAANLLNVSFVNNTVEQIQSMVGVYGKDAKVAFASVSMADNTVIGEDSALVTVYTENKDSVKGSKLVFKNNKAQGQLINVFGKDSYIDIDEVKVDDNNTKGLVRLYAYEGGYPFGGTVEFDNNELKGILYASGSNTYVILDSLNNNDLDTTLLYLGANGSAALKGNTNLKGNDIKDNKPIIYVDKDATLYFGDKAIVDENNTTNANPVNIYVASGAYISSKYLNKENEIASESIIRFTVESPEQEVFKYWNGTYIKEFNNFDKYEVYLPQEIFKLDKAETDLGYAVYKKGVSDKVTLNVGSDYATLVFRTSKRAEDIVATQYIARNVLTYVDKVMLNGLEDNDQLWGGPSIADETKNANWLMTADTYNAKVSGSTRDVFLLTHSHKLCGLDISEDCKHLDGSTHQNIKFTYVTSQDDIVRIINADRNKPVYLALLEDIELDRQFT
ncbi:MAG: hypothetical protein II411_05370, partial [Lachnospiraceae bacterium]|nr:hypothetical protein [Lachnospiraceae bacterium]